MSDNNSQDRRMRHKAHNLGHKLLKSRARNPRDVTYGGWMIANNEGIVIAGGESPGYNLTLDEVGEWLDEIAASDHAVPERTPANIATAKIKTSVWNAAYGAALGLFVIEEGWNTYTMYDTSTRQLVSHRGRTAHGEDDLPGVFSSVWREREEAGVSVDPVGAADDVVAYLVRSHQVEVEFTHDD